MKYPWLWALGLAMVGASNPFDSDVIALTPKNWKDVETSPHAWFVSVCRATCGYCARLTPEWQKLAGAMKKTVKIAYWDTEQGAATPPLFGQIKGTPTIKFLKPSKKNPPGVYKKKDIQDYNGAREMGPMKEFAEANMPSSVEKVEGQAGLDNFLAKAEKYGLPRALAFSDKPLSPTLKAISTEYRRRILIGEVRTTKPNQAILTKYGVTTKDLPKIIALDAEGKPIPLDKKPTYNAIDLFIGKHALKKAAVSKEEETAAAEEQAAEAKKAEAKKTKAAEDAKKKEAKKKEADKKKQDAEKKSEEPKPVAEEIDMEALLAEAEAQPKDGDKINYYAKQGSESDQKFQAMKIKELKLFLQERGEACADCVEKAHFVRRAIQFRDAPVVEAKSEL